jgi:hypothetical protein
MYHIISFLPISLATVLLFDGITSCNAYTLKCPNLRQDGYFYRGDEDGLYEGGSFGYHNKYKLPVACDSAADNTRGSYSAALKPCVFSFHKCDKDDGTAFQASTVCSDKNRINKETIKEYVRMWPDECVGDFARCYSVDRDESIFTNFFCEKKPNWKIPEDTTHIRVSCIEDKQAKIAKNANKTNGGDEFYEREKAAQQEQFLMKIEKEEAHMRHLEIVAVVGFVLSFSACLIIVKCAYTWLLRPYYERLATHED